MKKEVKSEIKKPKNVKKKDDSLKQTKTTSEAKPKKKVVKETKTNKPTNKTSKKEAVKNEKVLEKKVSKKTSTTKKVAKKADNKTDKKTDTVEKPNKKTTSKPTTKSATKKKSNDNLKKEVRSSNENIEKKISKTSKSSKTSKAKKNTGISKNAAAKNEVSDTKVSKSSNPNINSKDTKDNTKTEKTNTTKKTAKSTAKKTPKKTETPVSKPATEKPKNTRVKRTLIKSNNEAEDISAGRKNKKKPIDNNKSESQTVSKPNNTNKSSVKSSNMKTIEENENRIKDNKINDEKNTKPIENKKSTKSNKRPSKSKTESKNKEEQNNSDNRNTNKSHNTTKTSNKNTKDNKKSNKINNEDNEQLKDSKGHTKHSEKSTNQKKHNQRKDTQNKYPKESNKESNKENKKDDKKKDDNRNKQKDDRKDEKLNRGNKKDNNKSKNEHTKKEQSKKEQPKKEQTNKVQSNKDYSNKYNDRENKQKNNKPIKNVEELLIKPVFKNYRIRESEFVYKEINEDALITTSQKFNPTIKNTIKETQVFLRDKLFVDKMVVVVVAVSGGVDSVVLLDILANLSNSFMFELHIAHFDHGLRGKESEEDAIFVEELAKKYNIPFHKSKGKVKEHAKKYKKSIEEAARVLRYKFFEKVVLSVNAHFLATAHNANDSVETFLMNLIRGAGLTGLSGIPAKRGFIRNINLLRPILKLSKIDIREYAKQRNLEWREDSTNADNIFTRNRIRNELIPYLEKEFNPNIIKVIGRASSLVNYADRYITSNISSKIDSIIDFKDNNRVHINISMFMTFDEFIRSEMLSFILQKNFKFFKVNLNILDKINDICSSKSGSIYEINSDINVVKDRNNLIITSNRVFQNVEIEVQFNKVYQIGNKSYRFEKIKNSDKIVLDDNPELEYINADNLPNKLILRTIKDGDSFKPLGMEGTMKISDYLINNKISIIDKKNIIVLTDKVNILWVCGHRINNDFKVKKNSEKLLKMTVKTVEIENKS